MTVKEFMELEPGDVIVGGPEQYFIFIGLENDSMSSGFFTEKLSKDLSGFEKYYDDEWDSWDFALYNILSILTKEDNSFSISL